MFKHAVVRTPSASIADGISSAGLGRPDYAKALEQHRDYVRALQDCGLSVTILPAADAFPDAVFVEDAALCTPHCAVVTRPGAPSRRGEAALMEPTLRGFYERLERIEAPIQFAQALRPREAGGCRDRPHNDRAGQRQPAHLGHWLHR